MAKAWVGIRHNRPGRPKRLVFLVVSDSNNRTIVIDDTGYSAEAWRKFIDRGAQTVAALRVLERIGHRTEHTWEELVEAVDLTRI